MKLKALLAAAALFAIGSAAQAATIERTFDVTASDFFLTGGSSPPTPVDPVTLDFTLIWDPSVSVTSASTAGFTINAFNLPDPPIRWPTPTTAPPRLSPSRVFQASIHAGSEILRIASPSLMLQGPTRSRIR
jgi:hypothetical protein